MEFAWAEARNLWHWIDEEKQECQHALLQYGECIRRFRTSVPERAAPASDAVQRDTGRTRKIACGWYTMRSAASTDTCARGNTHFRATAAGLHLSQVIRTRAFNNALGCLQAFQAQSCAAVGRKRVPP